MKLILGEPSWRIASDCVEAFLTETGAHLGPVTFRLGERTISPYHCAPWWDELPDLPPILRVLRGDFLCLPFGGNDEEWNGEQHPIHGVTANEKWTLVRVPDDFTRLEVVLDSTVRPFRATRSITLDSNAPVVYQQNQITGGEGPMAIGSHAMLHFKSKGLISTSPFAEGRTLPVPFEGPDGKTSLAVDASFQSLEEVPLATGGMTSLRAYPARPGCEDLVMLLGDQESDFAWSAVHFPAEGYIWFQLKNPRQLAHTVLWHSNGGRSYSPWNGRHLGVMGIEEVTAYFHLGQKASAEPNPVSDRGFPTTVPLDGGVSANLIQGVARSPGTGPVKEIHRAENGIVLECADGATTFVSLDLGCLVGSDL
jgi:hypothetical protein